MEYYIDNHKLRYLKPNYHIEISLIIKRYIGTWPPVSKYQRYIYFVYTILSFIFLLGIYLTVQAINIYVIWGDIERMIASAFLLMTNTVHAAKIIIIIQNQLRIQKLLNLLLSPLFTRDNIKYERIVTYYSWQGIYHHIIYQSFGGIAVFCWSFTPIADAIAGLNRRLPMDAWYPYDIKSTPQFELTCGHQAIAVIIGCIHNISMDTLITGLLNSACCQIQIIKHNLYNIDNIFVNIDNIHDEINQRLMNNELVRCIEHMNIIMKFVMEIKRIFGWIILAQLSVNCIIICFTAFHITKMTIFIPTETFGMMMYLCCMTYQIFIYCYHGNELALQSRSISDAVFASNWWKFNKQYKKSMGILITRSHKSIIFTAGPIVELSLRTFVNILRMSYSFFTILKTTTTN